MHMELERVLPNEIEKRSMEIITSELPHPIDEKVADVVRRVIHTCISPQMSVRKPWTC